MKQTFSIEGMHCNSCCMLIENELKGKVNSIKASFKEGKAEIDFDPKKISEEEIKEKIEKLGYCVASNNIENKKNNKKSALERFGFFIFIGALLIVAFVLYSFLSKNYNFDIPSIGENGSLLLLFMVGILTGFHCIAMCGGFVVSYTAKNAMNEHKSYKQHFAYGGAKVISYTIFGGIFGLIGGIFVFSIGLRAGVAIFAGIFMIFYALSIFGIKFFRKFQINPKFLTAFTMKASAEAKGTYKRPIITGLLNGLFIACGPLQAMYLYAAGTGSFTNGATALAAFGLGTLPVMIGFGTFASVISHKTTRRILKISAVIVLILGLIMINRGLSMTGSQYSFSAIGAKIFGGPIEEGAEAVLTNGVPEVNMDVTGAGYSPNSFVVKKGVPIKWNVNVKELTT
ncbi:hypothetical protein A3K73_08325 [Candidatus Pacearchaeota archaeon RBG_13_36_9]|nr:MAG: hypothetical protein A3K73_08325 [Candidatus Pacearchaeota archaeon RBG_13_36_9]